MFEVIQLRFFDTLRRAIPYIMVAGISAAIAFSVGVLSTPQVNYTGSGTIITGGNKLEQIQAVVYENFIGDVTTSEMMDAAADAIVQATGDRWSYYMTPSEYALYQQQMQNSYDGIGVTVGAQKIDGGFVIEKVQDDSGAAHAGLQPGDIITHVDGQSVAQLEMDATRELIRGTKGTAVELTISRNGEIHRVLVTRGSVAIEVTRGQMLENGVGLVTIANFDSRCAAETISVIEQLKEQGAKALIFDVRNNPGGYKEELVKLLDYLLPEGVLFRSESNTGETSEDTSDANCLKMPMAVLINENSYSAAEFFAAALVEYKWAFSAGQHTTGKGYYQTVIELNDGSAINLSVGKYCTPNGVSLAEVGGIAPGIEVLLEEEVAEQLLAGTLEPANDPQVQAAAKALLENMN